MANFDKKDYQPTQLTADKLQKFEGLDKQFRAQWDAFYQKHQAELDALDQLREQRNVALDEATRELRAEAERVDIRQLKSFKVGAFEVQKKESYWYIPERFIQLAKSMNLLKKAKDEGAVVETVEIDYARANDFLKKNSLDKQFETCIDGKELTPAISGPKPIAPFAAEVRVK